VGTPNAGTKADKKHGMETYNTANTVGSIWNRRAKGKNEKKRRKVEKRLEYGTNGRVHLGAGV